MSENEDLIPALLSRGSYPPGLEHMAATPGFAGEPPQRDATGRRILTHGATGWKRGCRCEVCEAASGPHSSKRGVKTARLDEDDRRTERPSVPLSPRELALVDQARGEVPRGRYLREAVMEVVARNLGITEGDVDTASREATRQPNRSKQQQEGQQT